MFGLFFICNFNSYKNKISKYQQFISGAEPCFATRWCCGVDSRPEHTIVVTEPFFFFKLIYRNDCLTPKGRDLCVHGHLAALSLVHTHLHWREGSEPGWPAVPEGPTVAWWRSWCRGGSTPRPLWTRAHRQGADPLGSADTRGPGLSDAPYGPAGPAGFPLDESRFRLGTGLTPPEAPGFQHPGNNPPPPQQVAPRRLRFAKACCHGSKVSRRQMFLVTLKPGGSAGLYWAGI